MSLGFQAVKSSAGEADAITVKITSIKIFFINVSPKLIAYIFKINYIISR